MLRQLVLGVPDQIDSEKCSLDDGTRLGDLDQRKGFILRIAKFWFFARSGGSSG